VVLVGESPTHRYMKSLAKQILERYGFAVTMEFWAERGLSRGCRFDVVGFCVEKEVCEDHVVVVEIERNRSCEGDNVLSRVVEAARFLNATIALIVARIPECYNYVESSVKQILEHPIARDATRYTSGKYIKVHVVESLRELESVLVREVSGERSSGRLRRVERRVGGTRILAYDRDSYAVMEDVAIVGSRGFITISASKTHGVEVRVVISAQDRGVHNAYLRKAYARHDPQL